VILALKKVAANMPPPLPMKRPGRPKLVYYRMMERLRLFITRNPFKTVRKVKQELHGFDKISVRRIQELLQKNLKLPAKSAAKKPLLTLK
jgi:hypothetical protein